MRWEDGVYAMGRGVYMRWEEGCTCGGKRGICGWKGDVWGGKRVYGVGRWGTLGESGVYMVKRGE